MKDIQNALATAEGLKHRCGWTTVGRVKSLTSTFRKVFRRCKALEDVRDLIALRVVISRITEDREEAEDLREVLLHDASLEDEEEEEEERGGEQPEMVVRMRAGRGGRVEDGGRRAMEGVEGEAEMLEEEERPLKMNETSPILLSKRKQKKRTRGFGEVKEAEQESGAEEDEEDEEEEGRGGEIGEGVLQTTERAINGELQLREVERGVRGEEEDPAAPLLWEALEAIRGMTSWKEDVARFKDYVTTPKPNGYQSIHLFLEHPGLGAGVEVQLRTLSMHREAEYGFAAHALYKGGILSRDDVKDLKTALTVAAIAGAVDSENTGPGESHPSLPPPDSPPSPSPSPRI